jgi:predicted permease
MELVGAQDIWALKLLLLPALTWLGCIWLGVGGVSLAVAVLFNGLPTATSAFILARQLGGDHRLMAAIITGQTALSMASIPFLMRWLV